MKTAKRIFTLTLIIILTIGVSGCMGQSNKKIMLEHLEKKYGKEFGVWHVSKSGYFPWGGTPFMDCYPKGGDPETEHVKIEMNKDENGEITFRDNYFGILIREDFEEDMLSILADLPLSMKAYYSNSPPFFNEIFDGTKTYADFKQWVKDGNSQGLTITIAVPMDGTDKSEKEEYANQIFEKFEQDVFLYSVDVRFYPSEVFEKITRANFIELYKVRYEYALFSKIINR